MTDGPVEFQGRVLLVTGAGRGLGRDCARLLAARGAKVVCADNGSAMDGAGGSAGPAASVVEEITAAGGEAVACVADLATEDGAAEAVDAAVTAFGRIDGLLHGASTVPDNAPVARMSSADLERVMRINPFAGLWLARAAWPRLAAQGYGRILYMTSAGIYGSAGNAPYAAAKAAIIGMTRCLALEGAEQGVRVNAMAPAALTRMTERLPSSAYADWFRRTMRPERVAPTAAWLMSEACDVNGEVFHVGGGRIARMTLAESAGMSLAGETPEDVRDAAPAVLADEGWFHPATLTERALRVAAQLGYDGGMQADAFTVRPAGED